MLALEAQVVALRAEVAALQAQCRELHARLGQDASNSSRPPSTDPPQAAAKRKLQAPPSGRTRGGQPGHPGSFRALLPVEQVDQVVAVMAALCRHRGQPFPDTDARCRARASCQQGVDLLPLAVRVTEDQMEVRRCGTASGRGSSAGRRCSGGWSRSKRGWDGCCGAALCRGLNTWWAALWTFARVDGVEPTNNGSEPTLRPAVLWCKGSFGSDSEAGSRFVERVLTMVASCRQQGRRLLDFLVAAGEAAVRGIPPPSLLPAPQGAERLQFRNRIPTDPGTTWLLK